ncbi:hypothetical protein RRG08_015254 [Elysia crispata]|uniref:Uncharacterized protein n=1 Tax=Elysia crispata TaxID=231223 RepID=A0AAE1D836_9GAST|nr:hypothetical protein RRG08_015254 [Elysia crispata]
MGPKGLRPFESPRERVPSLLRRATLLKQPEGKETLRPFGKGRGKSPPLRVWGGRFPLGDFIGGATISDVSEDTIAKAPRNPRFSRGPRFASGGIPRFGQTGIIEGGQGFPSPSTKGKETFAPLAKVSKSPPLRVGAGSRFPSGIIPPLVP